MRRVLMLVVLVSSCTISLPPPLTRAQFDSFQPGATTAADVEAKLGKPMSRSVDKQGNAILVWGGATAGQQSQAITLTFGPDGKMQPTGNTFTEMDWPGRGASPLPDDAVAKERR